jgi:FkbM family methyltransferase
MFYVPPKLLDEFLIIISELVVEEIYKFNSKYDVIIDIGGFLGESAWWFLTENLAKKVIVFEPAYYEICVKNIGDVAEVYPYAIHWTANEVKIETAGGSSKVSGKGKISIPTKPLASILSQVSGRIAVKMDCEGFEESLPHTPCDLIRKVNEYIIEIHPSVDTNSIINYKLRF